MVKHKERITEQGFTIIKGIFNDDELEQMHSLIAAVDTSKPTFCKSVGLFAIRQFLKEVPDIQSLVFNTNLKNLITELFGEEYFAVKSI